MYEYVVKYKSTYPGHLCADWSLNPNIPKFIYFTFSQIIVEKKLSCIRYMLVANPPPDINPFNIIFRDIKLTVIIWCQCIVTKYTNP
jgi:hypothetical protein